MGRTNSSLSLLAAALAANEAEDPPAIEVDREKREMEEVVLGLETATLGSLITKKVKERKHVTVYLIRKRHNQLTSFSQNRLVF